VSDRSSILARRGAPRVTPLSATDIRRRSHPLSGPPRTPPSTPPPYIDRERDRSFVRAPPSPGVALALAALRVGDGSEDEERIAERRSTQTEGTRHRFRTMDALFD
jgi:hypothetical protein